MGRLVGATALITGGTSGIGLATAHLFVKEGARVVVTGLQADKVAAVQQLLGSDALVLCSDAANLVDIDQLVLSCEQHLGRLDVLFLNAGICKVSPLNTTTEAAFTDMLNVNLKSVFFTIQKALPICGNGTSIVVTTSIANILGMPNFSLYGASKAALRSLVKTLSLELIGKGIRINAISPGPIDTPIFERFGLPVELIGNFKQDIANKSPIKRFGTSEEVAKAVLFLASDESSYLVGSEIIVDGGMSLL